MSDTNPTTVRPENWADAGWRSLLLVIVQFGLLVWVFHEFELEGASARMTMLIALGGFLMQLFLPLSWRRWWFVGLSILAVGLVLNPAAAAWVAGIGLVLIGLCHLPVAYAWRVTLVVVVALGLAALRIGWVEAPFPSAVWVVLASFFMFRLIVYLYDLRHEPKVDAGQTLAYFFLLPNACFPLFPVVDYRTFTDSYHSRPAVEIYQQGLHWMTRGVVHLLLFRVVYFYFVVGPEEVTDLGTLVQFLLANILLYLRVSGQFHLIVGMLKMFGWDLPETNHLYFLASSFNEYWRRINIYWKDFMTKVFYLPTYMALAGRGLGQTAAVAIATVGVFMISWQLHSYQWFWLQGDYPVRAVDAVFWGSVGVLVLLNTLREVNRRQRRFISNRSRSLKESAVSALKVIGTFSVICVLWSLWTSVSLSQWLILMRAGTVWGGPGWLPAALVGLLAFAGLFALARRSLAETFLFTGRPVAVISILVLALGLVQPSASAFLGEGAASVVATVAEEGLSARDRESLIESYYDKIQRVDRLETPLWEMSRDVPQPEPPVDFFDNYPGFVRVRLKPNVSGIYRRRQFTTNRWGMRDRDYTLERPEGTLRIAILGSSHVLGSGLADGKVYHELLEDRLNREGLGDIDGRFEILNLGQRMITAIQQPFWIEEGVLRFEPQAIFYVAHTSDLNLLRAFLNRSAGYDTELPHPDLVRRFEELGLGPEVDEEVRGRILRSTGDEFLLWAYRQIVEVSRENGIVPFWVYQPLLGKQWPMDRDHLQKLAVEAGFEILSLADVYAGQDFDDLKISRWDYHPDEFGNELLAERLYQELAASKAFLALLEDR